MSLAALIGLSACALDLAEDADFIGDDEELGAAESEVLVPRAPSTGSVSVTLHPGPSAVVGSATVVTFGAPFPPGALTSASKLRAFSSAGAELKIHAVSVLPWRAWPGRTGYTESVRAAQVSVQVTFAARTPMVIRLDYGASPTMTLPAPADPIANWVAVTDGSYPSGTVREPRVYAAFPASWLSASFLRSRPTAIGTDASWSWFDTAMVGFARTAVNDLPSSVTERLNVTTDYEPWLFDRTATLFGVYARTGDVTWMRQAHRSAQFYLRHVDSTGTFDLRPGDLKYAYGRSLLMDFIFTGDPALVAAIRRIAGAGARWNPNYTLSTSFWTERHQTYALLAGLAAWEATGVSSYADRVRAVATASFNMALDPYGSWRVDKCMLHSMQAHEGIGGDVPICSPWMSGLFADAVWQYYIQTDDRAALTFLANLADYVRTYGLYGGGEGLSYLMPWYMASSQTTYSEGGPWGDIEHTCDVAAVVARGAWSRRELGGDSSQLKSTAQSLITSCRYILNYWHRTTAPTRAEWRLSPGRKFNWWFGTTSDLPWLMSAL